MTKTVISSRFYSVFRASIASMAISYVLTLTDSIVAGQFIGDEAVAAMMLVSPIMTFVIFLSYIVADGLAMMFSYAKGRNDRVKANELFGMGVIVSIVIGVVVTVILVAFRTEILSLWKISPELMNYADEYYRGLMFIALPNLINIFFYTIYVAEGEENICVRATTVSFVVNVILDIVLGYKIGVFGIAIASVISTGISFLFHVPYLFSKNCSLRFTRYWNAGEMWQGIFYSWYHSMDTLCLALLPIIFSEYVIFRFGEDHLIVVTVINNMLTLLIAIYTGIVDCLQPMICQYHAEGALHSIYKTMRLGMRSTHIVTFVMIVFSFGFAHFLPGLFGVEQTGTLYGEAVHAVRIFMPFTLFLGAVLMLGNYYIYVEQLNLGAAIKFLLLLILPSAGMFAGHFAPHMMWVGVGASFIVALLVTRILTRKKSGLLLIGAKELAQQFSFDTFNSSEQLSALMKALKKYLATLELDDGRKKFLSTTVAEVFNFYVARKEIFQLEVSLLPKGDSITLIFRDNGEPFNSPEQLPTLYNVREKNYMVSGDENKLVVVI